MNPHDLIQKHLDAALTPDEAATLAAALAADPALAAEFAAATRMDAALATAIRETAHTALYTRRFQRAAEALPPPRPARQPWPVRRIGIAAGIAAMLGGAWWALPARQSSPALPVAEKKRTAPPVMASASPAPAIAGGERVTKVESSKLRRTLRQFQGAGGNLRAVPVSHALASLETTWKENAPKNMAAIPIQLSAAARQRYTRPEDEPLVTLEIPGASLLANLNLLAAQAGLKTSISDTAITLEPDPQRDDGNERTWTLPLDQPTLAAFIDRAGKQATLASWMPQPQPVRFAAWKDVGEASLYKGYAVQQQQSGNESLALNANGEVVAWASAAHYQEAVAANGQRQITGFAAHDFLDPAEFDPPAIPQVFGDDVAAADPSQAVWNPWLDRAEFSHSTTCPTGQTANCTQCHTPAPPPSPVINANQHNVPELALTNRLAAIEETRRQNATLFSGTADGHTNETSLALRAVNGAGFTDLNNGADVNRFLVPQDLPDSFVSDEINTIELNLAPEVVDFEDFINYGTPIQTYTTPAADPPATLLSLLTAHGLPAGASYDAAAGQLTARAPLTQLRTASAAIEALREAVNQGCCVKFRLIKWPAGTAFAKLSRGTPTTTESSWQTEMKKRGGTLEAKDAISIHQGSGLSCVNILSGQRPNQEWAQLSINAFSFPGGTGIKVEAVLALNLRTGGVSGDVTHAPEMQNTTEQVSTEFQPGEWQRWDYPATGDAPARTVLVNIESASVPPPAR